MEGSDYRPRGLGRDERKGGVSVSNLCTWICVLFGGRLGKSGMDVLCGIWSSRGKLIGGAHTEFRGQTKMSAVFLSLGMHMLYM